MRRFGMTGSSFAGVVRRVTYADGDLGPACIINIGPGARTGVLAASLALRVSSTGTGQRPSWVELAKKEGFMPSG